MSAPVVESTLLVDGIRTPVLSAGDPEAHEAVVFVHGNPGSGRDWRDLVAAVGEHARAVAWDAPGFGRADKPADFDYTVPGYAGFVARALEHLRIDRVHLVLHDFGGPWGLRWALDHPDRFASATLINTGVLVDYSWHLMARLWRTPVLGEVVMATATRPHFRALLRIGNPRGLPADFVDGMYDDFDAGTRRAVLRLYRATAPGAMGSAVAELHRLDRPALVVWGAEDPYIPVEQAERQRLSFPSAEVHLLEDSGHWPFADNPDRVRDLVVAFIRSVLGR